MNKVLYIFVFVNCLFFSCLFVSCTINLIQTDSEGAVDDIVDTDAKPSLTIPVPPIRGS